MEMAMVVFEPMDTNDDNDAEDEAVI